jgi:flavin reductase (DIM6/NTAB) family NADH-FMN oxidoreductase RutF
MIRRREVPGEQKGHGVTEISQVLRLLDREVWLLTADNGTQRAGLIATSVNDASIAPDAPRISVGIAKQHHTWSVVESCRAFRVSLLDEAQLEVVWHFGLKSGHDVDKFAAPLTLEPVAWLDCKVEASVDTGDRTFYVAEIVAGKIEKQARPLTMKRLLELAPPDKLQALRAGLQRDGAVDGEAIRRWREARPMT